MELPATLQPSPPASDQLETANTLWTSDDGKIEVGVWECLQGRFTARRDANSEICHIVSGRVTLHGPGGAAKDVGPGEFLPLGWEGEWTIHEKTRKLTSCIRPDRRSRCRRLRSFDQHDLAVGHFLADRHGALILRRVIAIVCRSQ